jgi:hypothetical protein
MRDDETPRSKRQRESVLGIGEKRSPHQITGTLIVAAPATCSRFISSAAGQLCVSCLEPHRTCWYSLVTETVHDPQRAGPPRPRLRDALPTRVVNQAHAVLQMDVFIDDRNGL